MQNAVQHSILAALEEEHVLNVLADVVTALERAAQHTADGADCYVNSEDTLMANALALRNAPCPL